MTQDKGFKEDHGSGASVYRDSSRALVLKMLVDLPVTGERIWNALTSVSESGCLPAKRYQLPLLEQGYSHGAVVTLYAQPEARAADGDRIVSDKELIDEVVVVGVVRHSCIGE